MSLSKQLLILISIIFAVNFILSMDNIKSYLEVESTIHAQDTATSLGLSLSPHMTNEQDPILRTMMNAIFDTGYFKEMRLVNVDGEDLVKLNRATPSDNSVPDWVIELIPMEVASATSEISSGWNMTGQLYVTINPDYGYLKLYQQAKISLISSLVVFFAALLLLVFVLRLTLKSLKEIEKQANEISAGNFVTIENLPWTQEVKSVASSMNSMSQKIGAMISRLNDKVDTLTENLKRDPLTNLFNKATFDENVQQALSSNQSGFALLLKFDDLTHLAKEKGNEAVDQLLIDFTKILNDIELPNVSAYRLSGSKFSLLAIDTNHIQISSLAESLKSAIIELGQQYTIDDMVHIGIVPFDHSIEFSKLSSAMLEAYEQARNIGQNAFFVKDDITSAISSAQWKAFITKAIEENTPEITFTAEAYNYTDSTSQKVMEEAFTVIKDDAGTPLSIGTFFSMAQEFDLVEQLDKCIVNKVIALMEQTKKSTPVTINLSMTSIISHDFNSWLKAKIANTSIKPELLSFSVTAYAAAKNITGFASFNRYVRTLGATTLLKRYSSDIIAIDNLSELHISYLRLARDLTTDISGNTNKSHLLEIMHEVATLLDIKVLAEGVSDYDDLTIVKKAGIYGISH